MFHLPGYHQRKSLVLLYQQNFRLYLQVNADPCCRWILCKLHEIKQVEAPQQEPTAWGTKWLASAVKSRCAGLQLPWLSLGSELAMEMSQWDLGDTGSNLQTRNKTMQSQRKSWWVKLQGRAGQTCAWAIRAPLLNFTVLISDRPYFPSRP